MRDRGQVSALVCRITSLLIFFFLSHLHQDTYCSPSPHPTPTAVIALGQRSENLLSAQLWEGTAYYIITGGGSVTAGLDILRTARSRTARVGDIDPCSRQLCAVHHGSIHLNWLKTVCSIWVVVLLFLLLLWKNSPTCKIILLKACEGGWQKDHPHINYCNA